MKSVFFHIGSHRTGTTYFQSVISSNREELAERGCLVPNTGFDGVTHSHLALCLPSQRAVVNRRMRSSSGIDYELEPYEGPSATEWYTKLAEELRQSDANTAIVSSECFLEWLDVEALRDQLAEAGVNAHFVAFLRRQDRWIESVYSQVIKDPYLAYAGTFNELPQHGQLDFNAELGHWIESFGTERMHVRLYEENAHPTAITREIFSIMGLETDWLVQAGSPVKNGYLNASLDECCVEVLRALNARQAVTDWVRHIMQEVSKEFQERGEYRNWRLPRYRAWRIRRKNAASNRRLFARLGIEPSPNWGALTKAAYSNRKLKRGKYEYLFSKLQPALEPGLYLTLREQFA